MVKKLTVLGSTITNSLVFLLKKNVTCKSYSHIFSKYISIYAIFNDQKGKRIVQGVPQSHAASLPRHQEEEEIDKTQTSANRTNVRKAQSFYYTLTNDSVSLERLDIVLSTKILIFSHSRRKYAVDSHFKRLDLIALLSMTFHSIHVLLK